MSKDRNQLFEDIQNTNIQNIPIRALEIEYSDNPSWVRKQFKFTIIPNSNPELTDIDIKLENDTNNLFNRIINKRSEIIEIPGGIRLTYHYTNISHHSHGHTHGHTDDIQHILTMYIFKTISGYRFHYFIEHPSVLTPPQNFGTHLSSHGGGRD